MKRALKFIGKILLGFVSFILLYLLSAWVLSGIRVDEKPNGTDEISMYILSNGVHTDLVMPTKTDLIDWSERIKFEHSKAADSTHKYVAMGWGDKGFYLETPTWGDLTASTAFKAATGLSTTAMHVTYHQQMVLSETCKLIKISREEYALLISYIHRSFQQDAAGNYMPIATDANYGNTDAFYEANGSYSMFTTCNTWANSGLKASGQRAALWTAFDSGIFSKYE